MKKLIILMLITSLITLGCVNSQTAKKETNKNTNTLVNIDFKVLESSEHGGLGENKIVVIKSNDELKKEQSRKAQYIIGGSKEINVDFSKNMVIVKHFPQNTTGGTKFIVEQVGKLRDTLIVYYSKKYPKPGNPATTVITDPYLMIELPKIDYKELNFLQKKSK